MTDRRSQRSVEDIAAFCSRGHRRTPRNTYTRRNGWRQCWICKIEQDRRYREENRELCNARSRRSVRKRRASDTETTNP